MLCYYYTKQKNREMDVLSRSTSGMNRAPEITGDSNSPHSTGGLCSGSRQMPLAGLAQVVLEDVRQLNAKTLMLSLRDRKREESGGGERGRGVNHRCDIATGILASETDTLARKSVKLLP